MEVNAIENKNSIEKVKETKSWFFEKINKINKPLAGLRKMERRNKLLILEMKIRNSLDPMGIKQ